METLKFDLSKTYGGFKPMNAVNNGPMHKRHTPDQRMSNLEDFTAAGIPYVRNHDASICYNYGGEHVVDITAIFPNFDADPYNPASYDFACTDEYLSIINLTGAKNYYRLGQKIEHWIKKYGCMPPKDFKKWAVICEHIIRHFTEGWNDGFRFDIEYWEIWNEPDIDTPDNPNKRTWGGTAQQFFDLFEITAKHLKSCFPHLKIGGPALAWKEDWADDFLAEMQKRNVPLDFFSWHCYLQEPIHLTEKAERIKNLLIKNGYEKSESILNEWNYVKGWSDETFIYSIESITGIKGAACTMACMQEAQKSSIDMLMYYDARPCVFNGLFDFYTLRKLKGYYPFKWFSEFFGKEEVRTENNAENIYTLCGVDKNGKTTCVVTYYTDNDEDAPQKEIKLDFGKNGKYEIYLLDKDHDAELVNTVSDLTFKMNVLSCILIKEL